MEITQVQKQVNELKRGDKRSAFDSAIHFEVSGTGSFTLVPIGRWALEDSKLISQMAEWRSKTMIFFLSHFEVSVESTSRFLENQVIKNPNRLLFLIVVDKFPVGQIGLDEIRPDSAVLDNMIRGELIGPRTLMIEAENRLISWAFDELGLSKLSLEVQSRNFLAKRIHQQLGFMTISSSPLRRVGEGDHIRFVPTSALGATEEFELETMELRIANWKRPLSPRI